MKDENLEKIFDAPHLNAEEIDLLMQLDSSEPMYVRVNQAKAVYVVDELWKMGYSYVGLLVDLNRKELRGDYVLEVRK